MSPQSQVRRPDGEDGFEVQASRAPDFKLMAILVVTGGQERIGLAPQYRRHVAATLMFRSKALPDYA
jgi:hypothetical protein